uniref:Uncharacterized protein n=1 Tax=Anguilla anguilla TaxID=7936 RepID=A0A0E9URS1_ANGAN
MDLIIIKMVAVYSERHLLYSLDLVYKNYVITE